MKIGCEVTYRYWWSGGWFFYLLLKTTSGIKTREGLAGMQQPMTSVIHRQIRELSYPGDSEMGLFFALAIPLDDPVSTKAISVAFFFEANYQLPNPEGQQERQQSRDNDVDDRQSKSTKKRSIDRRTIYAMVESKFESIGFPGRPCLLRSICETARHSLHDHNGLIGDIFRIIFTPSSSSDEGLPDEYQKAELNDMSDDCGKTYSLCPFDIYDYITGLSSSTSSASSTSIYS